MLEVFFLPSNLIATILFLVIILYWTIVLFGAVDFDVIDLDFDVDTDVDVDADAEMESTNIFGLNKILTFFNLGKVPFMVFMTFLIIPMWFGTVIINHALGIENFILGLVVMFPVFIGSMFIAKFLTMPFVKIFATLDKTNETRDILGTIGEVRMGASNEKTGQAEFKVGDAFMLLQIRTKDDETVVRGDSVMIVNDDKKDEYYIVEKQFNL